MLALMPLVAIAAIPDGDAAWTEVRSGDILVECTTADGLPWCRATATTDQKVEHLAAAIEDREAFPKYFPHVIESRVLSDADSFYLRIDLPSPMYDRDRVSKATRRDEEGGVRVYEWYGIDHPEAPVSDCCVRLAEAAGAWRLEPQPDGTTKIRYTWVSSMGASFPSWLETRAAVMHADETVTGTIQAAKDKAAN
jgi:hypothetical protein